jgi:hypothetical protein
VNDPIAVIEFPAKLLVWKLYARAFDVFGHPVCLCNAHRWRFYSVYKFTEQN